MRRLNHRHRCAPPSNTPPTTVSGVSQACSSCMATAAIMRPSPPNANAKKVLCRVSEPTTRQTTHKVTGAASISKPIWIRWLSPTWDTTGSAPANTGTARQCRIHSEDRPAAHRSHNAPSVQRLTADISTEWGLTLTQRPLKNDILYHFSGCAQFGSLSVSRIDHTARSRLLEPILVPADGSADLLPHQPALPAGGRHKNS